MNNRLITRLLLVILLIIYFIPFSVNIPYLLVLGQKGILNPFSLLFLPVPVSETILFLSLLFTILLTHLAFFYGDKGISQFLLDKLNENQCFSYPMFQFKLTLYLRWIVSPLSIVIIGLLGGALGFAFRSILVILSWYIYSTGLLILYYPNLERQVDRLNDITNNFREITNKAKGKIIYADNELMIKEKVLIARKWLRSKICGLENVVSFGYVSNTKIFVKCRNYPLLINCRDSKRAYKMIKSFLKNVTGEVSEASIREIENFIFLQKLRDSGIVILVGASVLLMLWIYIIF